jgi:transcriptional regulator with XRE-family HTH domain
LPICDRRVCIPRNKYLPSHNRGIPVPKTPTTVGGHLRRRRLELNLLQSQAARKLRVSIVTLSRWECDKVYPVWAHQPRIIEYLGYNPFTNPELGRPKGNESTVVAFLSRESPESFGAALRKRRLEQHKNGKQFAKELGVDARTLRDWEAGRHKPCRTFQERLLKLLKAGAP